jgi:hypothetical protein
LGERERGLGARGRNGPNNVNELRKKISYALNKNPI